MLVARDQTRGQVADRIEPVEFPIAAIEIKLRDAGVPEWSKVIRLGDTAYISFITDPDGNWIELSQRASLTGPLPDVAADRHRA